MNRRLATLVVLPFTVPSPAVGQLVTESINLQAGWNAVWVNLEPEPNSLNEVLAAQSPALDYQAVWTFEENRSTNFLLGGTPGRWFFHDRDIPAALSTLRVLNGHRGYLINMRTAGTLQLQGRPLIRSHEFTSQTSNLFGALAGSAPGSLTFEEFFLHPKAFGKIRSAGVPVKHDIFTLSADQFVRRTLTSQIQPNVAYWLNVIQDFVYPGPLDLTSSANGLSFGRTTSLRTISIEVPATPNTRTLTLQAVPCGVLSAAGACSTAGDVDWLEFRDSAPLELPSWQPLSVGATIVVPAGVTRVDLEVRARRSSLTSLARQRRGGPSLLNFPLLIDVTDDVGARAVLAASVSVEPVFGRWIGRASLHLVSVHPILQALPLDQADAPPMGMTLLLELPDPSAVQGGATPQLLDSLSVDTFRDGRPLTRRFTSVLFDRPVSLTADAGDPIDPLGGSGTLRGTLHISPEDPLNPYRHRYNPEHRQGYDITREITIKIESQQDTLTEELAGFDGTFGSQRLAGQYTEVITGLSVQPITVHGTFRLDRLVD